MRSTDDTESGSALSLSRNLWVALAVITAVRAALAFILPITTDEAYYLAWAKELDLGYFDHPPFVALLGGFAELQPQSPLLGRLGAIVAGSLTALWTIFLARNCGLRQESTLLAVLLLSQGSLMLLAAGLLITPDAGLLLFWVVALNEAAAALTSTKSRWLTAGLATGLGILAKYTMLFIGPVFLLGLWFANGRRRRGPLRSAWPYIGGVVCLVVLLPHLAWQAKEDWVTVRFQFAHGFALERNVRTEQYLPKALPTGDAELALAGKFDDLRRAEETAEKKKSPYEPLLQSLNRYFGFYGAQLGALGFLLIPLFALAWRRYRGQLLQRDEAIFDECRALVIASYLVPLVFFGLLAAVHKIEANWAAMFLIGAAVHWSPWLVKDRHWCRNAALLNGLVLSLVVLHARVPFLPTKSHQDRILKETSGFADLAALTRDSSIHLFAETYQLTAMLRFYGVDALQWPGLTRPSEFTRRQSFRPVTTEVLRNRGGFALVTHRQIPPTFEGFRAISLTQLRHCLGAGLQVIEADEALTMTEERCKKPIHSWFLVKYQMENEVRVGTSP